MCLTVCTSICNCRSIPPIIIAYTVRTLTTTYSSSSPEELTLVTTYSSGCTSTYSISTYYHNRITWLSTYAEPGITHAPTTKTVYIYQATRSSCVRLCVRRTHTPHAINSAQKHLVDINQLPTYIPSKHLQSLHIFNIFISNSATCCI